MENYQREKGGNYGESQCTAQHFARCAAQHISLNVPADVGPGMHILLWHSKSSMTCGKVDGMPAKSPLFRAVGKWLVALPGLGKWGKKSGIATNGAQLTPCSPDETMCIRQCQCFAA